MTDDSISQTQHVVGPANQQSIRSSRKILIVVSIKMNSEPWTWVSEEERETARTMVSRLHVELGHSDPRGMIDSLRRKRTHRRIIATAKKYRCGACEECGDGGLVQLLLWFYMNQALVFKLISSSGSILC